MYSEISNYLFTIERKTSINLIDTDTQHIAKSVNLESIKIDELNLIQVQSPKQKFTSQKSLQSYNSNSNLDNIQLTQSNKKSDLNVNISNKRNSDIDVTSLNECKFNFKF